MMNKLVYSTNFHNYFSDAVLLQLDILSSALICTTICMCNINQLSANEISQLLPSSFH